MIFEAARVESLLDQYSANGESQNTILEIHKLSDPLIRHLAYTISSAYADDLIQEGHVKLFNVIISKKYKSGKGNLYSFVRTVLTNCMIDFLRRVNICQELPTALGVESSFYYGAMIDTNLVDNYVVNRFPSLHSSVSIDAASYVICGICEQVCGKSKGIIKTLELLYPIQKPLSQVFYHSISIVLRYMIINSDCTTDDFSSAIRMAVEKESTLLPEVVLVLGDSQTALFMKIFKDVKIKL